MSSEPFSAALPEGALTRPPSAFDHLADRAFRSLALVAAAALILLLAYILWKIGVKALPAIGEHHFAFLTDSAWDVSNRSFGILPEIWGTLYSSLLALGVAGFFGLTVAIFLTQDFLPPRLAVLFRTVIEMLAAIPSVVFGLWGIFVVIPTIRPLADWLNAELGWLPFFGTTLSGPGLLPATIVLAIMVLPTITAISQDALQSIPYRTKEAAYGMGATKWEAILKVLLPTAAGGIFSALVLGFGRALGETMALAMLIGNSNQISLSLFSPGDTLASLLASHFPEAGEVEVGALMYAALVLLAITLLVNIAGNLLLALTQRRISGKS
ncbi:phosphate ABC transporter permease subunit PstC [Phaeospirillum tilakii]|uniref:Phosphate transport system permease protein n=1 Tax=Phaeospirillum tilakii TaxID=741673 RepID=A0ABW5C9C6_9PROT